MSDSNRETIPDLDWIYLQTNLTPSVLPETQKEKMWRKIKQNPFVPIGCLATATALCFGLYTMKTGNRRMSQMMMRTRVAAQAFTIAALLIGISLSVKKEEKVAPAIP